MLSSFYTRQLEVVLVGLENSGKTTLMNGKWAGQKQEQQQRQRQEFVLLLAVVHSI